MKEDLFYRQMQLLNRHLASSKKDLSSLLKEKEPLIILKDGSTHFLDDEELRAIADIIPNDMYKELMLPIFIELSKSKYGSGTARISGRAECLLVAKILDKKAEGDEMFIYRPELRILRKKLKTTTQYMFTTSIDFDDQGFTRKR